MNFDENTQLKKKYIKGHSWQYVIDSYNTFHI